MTDALGPERSDSHPHEPPQPPVWSEEGRCLICALSVCERERDAARAERDANYKLYASMVRERDEWKDKHHVLAREVAALTAAGNRLSFVLDHCEAPVGERVTHGRHCRCSACAAEDWTRITVPCGMHGTGCPAVYAPYDIPPPPVALADISEAQAEWLRLTGKKTA